MPHCSILFFAPGVQSPGVAYILFVSPNASSTLYTSQYDFLPLCASYSIAKNQIWAARHHHIARILPRFLGASDALAPERNTSSSSTSGLPTNTTTISTVVAQCMTIYINITEDSANSTCCLSFRHWRSSKSTRSRNPHNAAMNLFEMSARTSRRIGRVGMSRCLELWEIHVKYVTHHSQAFQVPDLGRSEGALSEQTEFGD